MGDVNRVAHSARRQAMRRKAQRSHSHFYDRCAHWSFSRTAGAEPIRWNRERWILAGTAFLIVVLSALVIPAWAGAMKKPGSVPLVHAVVPLTLPKLDPETVKPLVAAEDWQTVQVQPGQTLSDIFQGQGLTLTDLQHAIDGAGNARAFHQIKPGQEFQFLLGENKSLLGVRFDQDEASIATLRLDGAKPELTTQSRDVQRREHIAHGVIDSSLFGAASKAGMSNAMVLKLAEVFKFDIDFVQDLRVGDNFTVIYDDIYRDGAYAREGDIVAAEFINQGKRYTAYRFKNSDGKYSYFSEEGRPLTGSFLRIPVDFTRISSQFSAGRMHPILGKMRAHKGVDYAAPSGTPIHAAGDGVVKFRGWMNGYGNFVVIQHNATISTAYGHMSRFANLRVGQRVTQGSTIGYVGMTGLATGPHLHYEFRVNNAQRDPQTVTLPKPEPLPAAQLAKFKSEVVKPQLARLTQVDSSVKLARAKSDTRSDD
ncbi:murein DD-endopeptidase MepM/ murein hydrolase activator NlpD [Luteibacter sp. Sphag1AF]|uniref:OapA family protein n=1 Tax=Luteibacter sp. Sphag1AF TaxID=2587031 RepID=UPI00160A3B1C|nr:peptidoglycan DD-metalloendopeptidase family protein [Luteibacter sp. Sphag1AF]MBB3226779.1 murein DD-endopeptidase MepM/ murein hydrolase activator NlpD [Luteibacter sp. Sphag1AF]